MKITVPLVLLVVAVVLFCLYAGEFLDAGADRVLIGAGLATFAASFWPWSR